MVSNDGVGMSHTKLRIFHLEEGVTNNGCNTHDPSGITIIVNVIRNKSVTLQYLLASLL